MAKKILIIDDDIDLCLLLKRYLDRKGYQVTTASTASGGRAALKKNRFDLVLCDMRLPDMDGMDLLKQVRNDYPQIPVVIITGYSDVRMAVKTIKMGAIEYVTKPIHHEEILLTIEKALENRAEDEVKPRKTPRSTTDKKIVQGNSLPAKRIRQLIDLVAPTDMTVIILGESGIGKEVAARSIHEKSKRKNKPFVAIDCGALPENLAGSELFGHRKGAFTGALTDKTGQFELAQGGTLFLDEIGNLAYEHQVKLLRVIQERNIRKIGDTKDIAVDVRIIVATNDDLKKAAEEGDFREDIFYRLDEFRIELLPLRERTGDILLFAEHFLSESNTELERNVEKFSAEVEERLKSYQWPGNLREMKNVIKRGTLLSAGNTMELSSLPEDIVHPKFVLTEPDSTDVEITDLKSVVERAERQAIQLVLEKTAFNKSRTAKILKVDRKTLYNKMNAYGIDFDR